MEKELNNKLGDIFSQEVEKVVISNGKNAEFKKIVISKKKQGFQAEKFTQKQAFHESISEDQV